MDLGNYKISVQEKVFLASAAIIYNSAGRVIREKKDTNAKRQVEQ